MKVNYKGKIQYMNYKIEYIITWNILRALSNNFSSVSEKVKLQKKKKIFYEYLVFIIIYHR